jgi:hypothetical protein
MIHSPARAGDFVLAATRLRLTNVARAGNRDLSTIENSLLD